MDLNYNTVKGVHIYGILLDMMGKLEHIKKLCTMQRIINNIK